MGIKSTENKSMFKSWLNNFKLKTRSTENFVLLVFIISIPLFFSLLMSGKEVNGYSVSYKFAIANQEKYKEERLIAQSKEIAGMVYKKEAYLETLREIKPSSDVVNQKDIIKSAQDTPAETSMKQVQEKDPTKTALEEIQGTSDIGVVVLDAKTGAVYSNKSWVYDLPFSFEKVEQIVNALNSEGNIIAKELNGTKDFKEVYFTKTDLFESEIIGIRLLALISGTISAILFLIIYKKIYMFRKLGFKVYKDSLRWGYLNKVKNAWKTLLKKNLVIEEIIKDKVVWVVTIFIITSIAFLTVMQEIGGDILQQIYGPAKLIILIVAPLILVIHFIVRMLYRYETIEFITGNLESIKSGDFDIDAMYSDDPQIQKLSKGINDIRISYKNSIKERVKAEKLKTELISNVSHDLKTPLTSIINYVNIIQMDDITKEERKNYINILEKKSIKLRDLIEDLFEVSKMNSGKIKLEKNDIDLVQLVYQSIAELEDFDREKNIQFKIRGAEELYVNLDGMRISRVLQNLGTNAIKYGLNDTRVYIDINDLGKYVQISFKNISSYELDFDEKEIVERFSRGDKSRNSGIEGSGLGLAIAKSIVELHHGNFNIECEGDLFKAYIILPKLYK